MPPPRARVSPANRALGFAQSFQDMFSSSKGVDTHGLMLQNPQHLGLGAVEACPGRHQMANSRHTDRRVGGRERKAGGRVYDWMCAQPQPVNLLQFAIGR